MRKTDTLFIAIFVGFTVFADYAWSQSLDDFFGGSQSSGTPASVTTEDIAKNVKEELFNNQTPIERPKTAIDENLTVDVPPPAVNLDVADVVDKKGRYSPRLKINFTEFPLRSLTLANRTGKEQNTLSEASAADIIVLRIKNRLRLSAVDIVFEDRTAIISGTVPTDRQRSLVETMLRFEPGVDTVRNNIRVVP